MTVEQTVEEETHCSALSIDRDEGWAYVTVQPGVTHREIIEIFQECDAAGVVIDPLDSETIERLPGGVTRVWAFFKEEAIPDCRTE